MGDDCAICGEELAVCTEENPGFILQRFDVRKGMGLLGQFCNVEHLAEFVRTALEFLRDANERTYSCLFEIISTFFPEERADERVMEYIKKETATYGRWIAELLLEDAKKKLGVDK